MLVALSRRMGLESRQLHKALWLGGALMTVTSSYTLIKTVRDSLFLSRLPATWLPWVYLFVGVVTLAVSLIVGRLTHRLSARQSLVGSILGATIGLVLFSLAVGGSEQWVPAVFYLYVNVYGLIVVSQFWLYTNSRSDPREMKRICGLVGGGAILGGVVGGVLASTLGGWVSAEMVDCSRCGVVGAESSDALTRCSAAGHSPTRRSGHAGGRMFRCPSYACRTCGGSPWRRCAL